MSSNIFVTTLDLSLADKLKQGLTEQGFDLSIPAYTLFSGRKKGVSCTLYKSGKLTVQGKEMKEFIEFYLEPEILHKFNFTHQDIEETIDKTARIGIDESGKGDFFGPLCIAGVFAQGDEIQKLKAIGVRDSKMLEDRTILKLGREIREQFAFHVVRINPLKYNELYHQFGNLNHLLAWGHATTIEQLVLKTGCTNVIIDQFAAERVVINALKRKKMDVELTQRHRGEEDLVVAAASILARCAFLDGLERLGKEFGIDLPKGASAAVIKTGKAFVHQQGEEKLPSVAKMHFKTLDSII